MSLMTLSQAAQYLGSELNGQDAEIDCVSIDTRNGVENSLFFALHGPNFDAHEVLDEETDLPVAGVVVSRPVKHLAPFIQVADTRKALGKLAAAWRKGFEGKVVGLTGSNGKTTVKQMLAAVFAQVGATLATKGNLNNDLGVPLTLLNLRPEHEFAVVEMGANHPGEIGYLTDLVRPEIALITNAGPAHLEGFGSVAGVAKAKAEIFAGLDSDGIAVINADDDYFEDWQELNADRQRVTFGFDEAADVRIVGTDPLSLSINGNEIEVSLQMMGRHNASNAAAAAAVAVVAGISVEKIAAGLSSVAPVSGRLEAKQGPAGSTLINDTYNANPGSVKAAILVLSEQPGNRYLVLGDLAELGDSATEQMVEIGKAAKAAGIDGLFSLGSQAQLSSESFGEAGHHFDDLDSLVSEIKPRLNARTTVLVKGSRAARMERVIHALESQPDGNSGGMQHAI